MQSQRQVVSRRKQLVRRGTMLAGRSLPFVAGSAALLIAAAASAGALPSNPSVVAGSGVTFTNTPNSVTVGQSSSRAIINWQSFSIGAGNTVQFNNGSGATLNRVTSANPSSIAGSLGATGSVYLVNQNGIVVLPGGQVVTGGSFIASTRDTDNAAFMAGAAPHFTGYSSGTVDNQGSITSTGGDVVLIGQAVSNSGSISAPNGTAALAAGNDVLLQPASGSPRILIDGGHGDVTNTGTIAAAQAELNAAEGNVYALAGNTGVINATGTATMNGHVWLTADDKVTVAGAVSAQDMGGGGGAVTINAPEIDLKAKITVGAGGTIDGTGREIEVFSNAASIQNAVDVAATNGKPEINVDAGTYTEQVFIAKSLELEGKGIGATTIAAPATLATAFTTSGPNNPVVFVSNNAKVEISDLTVDGQGHGNGNYRFDGIAFHDAGGTIDNVRITGVRETPFNGDQHGVALYVINDDGQNRTINLRHSQLDDFQKNGTVFDGAGLTANVSDSTITGQGSTTLNAQNGLQYSDGATGTIEGNTIGGFDYSPASFAATGILLFDAGNGIRIVDNKITGPAASAGSIGLYVFNSTLNNSQNLRISGNTFNTGGEAIILWSSSGARISGNTIENYKVTSGPFPGSGVGIDILGGSANTRISRNTIANNDTGVLVETDAGSGTVLRRNNIVNNGVGLLNQSAFQVDAEHNWWGSASGPAAGEVTGNVDSSDWLHHAAH